MYVRVNFNFHKGKESEVILKYDFGMKSKQDFGFFFPWYFFFSPILSVLYCNEP